MNRVNKNQIIIAAGIAAVASHIGWKLSGPDAMQIAAGAFILSHFIEPYIKNYLDRKFPGVK